MLGNLYCSLLVLALGACIGSFLNVVIYRWPRGLSTREPSRSFCPACGGPIAWYDNIPVLSYVFLAGRCRHCQATISLQYPLVELATALIFLMTYDVFFVAGLRDGVVDLRGDWPVFVAHGVLFAGLIALSVMDLEAYMVDIKITWLVSAVGIAAHTMWTPSSSWSVSRMGGGWLRPGPHLACLAGSAAIGLLLGTWLLGRWAAGEMPTEELQDEPEPAPSPKEVSTGRRRLALAVLALLVVGYLVAMLIPHGSAPADVVSTEPARGVESPLLGDASRPDAARVGFGLLLVFLGLAGAASCPQPLADAEMVDALENEAPQARATAFAELMVIAPAVVLGTAAVIVLFMLGDEGLAGVRRVLSWSPTGQWQPLWGLATGLSGWIVGGALGWLARIVFTIIFGKEALGMGDVHILAAAGAVAGWVVALLGFFLAAPLALLAVLVIRLRRQSWALPYGPWLALGFLVAAVFQDAILRYLHIRWMLE